MKQFYISIRVTKDLKDWVRKTAAARGRTISNFIKLLIENRRRGQ